MRHILIVGAAFAAFGFITFTSANAQNAPVYEAGGPVQVGGWCLVDTSADLGGTYGYYQPCGTTARAEAPRHRRRH